MSNDSRPGKSDPAKLVVASPPDVDAAIERGIQGLFSEDFEIRSSSVEILGKCGAQAARALTDLILKRRGESHLLSLFAEAFAEIGKPALPEIRVGLDGLSQLRRPEDVYLLETFADLLGLLDDRGAAEVLRRQIEKLRQAILTAKDPLLRECCEAARIRLRHVLFDLGDRGGLDDLLSLLGDGRRRVSSGLFELLAKIGDKRALVPLARLYAIEEPVSSSGAHLIREAIREIARRDHLTSSDVSLLTDAGPAEQLILVRIFHRLRDHGVLPHKTPPE
jgi:HEAT repeat protein